jgi:YHS domain-containing protein
MRNTRRIQPNRLIRLYLAAIMSGLILSFSFNSHASHDVSLNHNGVVIGGYDPVAYFTMGEALPGSKDISTEYLGGTWLFVNVQHRELFLTNPGKYIPQYGGYCSSSSRSGGHGSANPRNWQIVDNKLYLFYSKPFSDGWIELPSTLAADKKWEKAKAGLLQQ